jgi:hypothetical protein
MLQTKKCTLMKYALSYIKIHLHTAVVYATIIRALYNNNGKIAQIA